MANITDISSSESYMHVMKYDNDSFAEIGNASNTQAINGGNNDPFIPLYLYIIVSILNSLIFLIGTFGNIMVILVVLKVRDMKTPTNMFLLNLSVADLLVLLVCQPAGLLEFFGKDRWFLGEFMCKLVPLMENGMLHVSILTMLAVTAERYNALCHPFKQRMICTVRTTVKVNVVIWVSAYVLTLPFLIMTELQDATFYDDTPIKVCRTIVNDTWRRCYTVFIFVSFFAMPFFILVGIYSKIIRQLMSDTLQTLTGSDPSAMNTIRLRKQVVYMLILIIVLFFISLFPIRVVSLWVIFTPSEDVIELGLEAYLNLMSWARIFMYLNSAGNPVIYSLTSTKFKTAFKKVLNRCSKRRKPRFMGYSYHASQDYKLKAKNQGYRGRCQHRCYHREHPCLIVHLVLVADKVKSHCPCQHEHIPLKSRRVVHERHSL